MKFTRIIQFYKKNAFLYTLQILAFIGILVTGIVYKQQALRIIPLFVSLIVMFLQSNVNRFNFLLGGINSAFYAIAYFSMELYSQAIYALLFSLPLQIISFVNWNKKADGYSTKLLKMPNKYRALLFTGVAIVWASVCLIYYFPLNYQEKELTSIIKMLLDNVTTVFGIVATILMMLRFIEYAPLQITGLVSSLFIYFVMLPTEPRQITFIIYTVYALICSVIAIRNMKKRYRAQQLN